MSKHFRPWKIDETHLLPASVQDYVPEDHLSRFIVTLVRESLDLCEIKAFETSKAVAAALASAWCGYFLAQFFHW
jgi:hypothetical protein